MEKSTNSDPQLTQSTSSEGSQNQCCNGVWWYFQLASKYMFDLTKTFFRNIMTGFMYTAAIDFLIFLYRHRKVQISLK